MTLATFALIMALALGLGVASRRGVKKVDMEDYLVAGRSFGAILLFVLAVGEVYSIGTIVGFPGGIYAQGASYGIWFMGYILLAYPIGYFLLPLMWRAGQRYGATTFPDVFRAHFGSRGLELVTALASVVFLIPWGQLQLTGLQVVFGALDLPISPNAAAVLGSGIAFGFILLSGVRAPAFVSLVKDTVLIVAAILVGAAAVIAASGIGELFESARVDPVAVTMQGEALTFAITTIAFQALAFYMFPFFALAIFTGKSERTVKRTQTFMPIYMVMYPFLVFASFYALATLPGLEGPAANTAFMAVAQDLLPDWALGVVAAAAALSAIVVLTVASLVIGALVSRNVTRGLSEGGQRRTVQVVVLAYLAVSLLLTLATPTLMLTIVNTAYYGIGQFLPGMLIVLFGGRVRPAAIAVGIVVADVLAVALYLLDVTAGGVNLGLIALGVNCLILLVTRLVWPAADAPDPIARMGAAPARRAPEPAT